VDRFLEHSRILVFGEGPKQQVFLSSADWMPRNFVRRVEVMFPIESENIRRRIVEEIIPTYMNDNTRTRIVRPDGTYARAAADGKSVHRSQYELLSLAANNELAAAADGRERSPFAFAHLTDGNGEAGERAKKKKKGAAK
jgi:polyphosphate kinase